MHLELHLQHQTKRCKNSGVSSCSLIIQQCKNMQTQITTCSYLKASIVLQPQSPFVFLKLSVNCKLCKELQGPGEDSSLSSD